MTNKPNENAPIIAVWISLISNIILTILKIVVGTLFHSPVLLADGYHNAGDVVASGAALTSMRISKQPADEDHPYGHGKAEVIGPAIVATILGLAAIYIAYESISAIFSAPEKQRMTAFVTASLSLFNLHTDNRFLDSSILLRRRIEDTRSVSRRVVLE